MECCAQPPALRASACPPELCLHLSDTITGLFYYILSMECCAQPPALRASACPPELCLHLSDTITGLFYYILSMECCAQPPALRASACPPELCLHLSDAITGLRHYPSVACELYLTHSMLFYYILSMECCAQPPALRASACPPELCLHLSDAITGLRHYPSVACELYLTHSMLFYYILSMECCAQPPALRASACPPELCLHLSDAITGLRHYPSVACELYLTHSMLFYYILSMECCAQPPALRASACPPELCLHLSDAITGLRHYPSVACELYLTHSMLFYYILSMPTLFHNLVHTSHIYRLFQSLYTSLSLTLLIIVRLTLTDPANHCTPHSH